MAVERTRDLRRRSGDRPERSDFDVANRADRWVACVAVILLVLGLLSFVEGLTVVAHADFGTSIHYLSGSLRTRGWMALCIGAVGIFVGIGARPRNRRWRWAAVTVLAMSAIGQLVMIPTYPGWLLLIFTFDCVAVWGLIASAKSSSARNLRMGSATATAGCAAPPSVKQENHPGGAGVRGDRRCGEDTHGRQTREWWQWRTCAQDVTRSWNEWLAADRFRSAECYGRYVSALDQAERAAAEFERVFLGTARGGE